MNKSNLFSKILIDIRDKSEILQPKEFRKYICKTLKDSISYYDWVGFYLSDGNQHLILAEFEGEPTIHTKIRFGKGICGQAAETKKTFLIKDVTKEKNYLSCSIRVKSEIVIPIIKEDKFIGELDIDSHTTNAFDNEDKEFLERICIIVAEKSEV